MLEALRDSESGPLFVMGSGPSLHTISDDILGILATHQTFACNRFVWWEKAFPTTWYSCTSSMVSLGVEPSDPHAGKGKFLFHEYLQDWEDDYPEGWIHVRKKRFNERMNPNEQTLPLFVYTGASSAFLMASLGAYMGYAPLYLLGCDMRDGDHVYGGLRPFIQPASWEQTEQLWGSLSGVVDCTKGGRLNQSGVLPYMAIEEVLL